MGDRDPPYKGADSCHYRWERKIYLIGEQIDGCHYNKGRDLPYKGADSYHYIKGKDQSYKKQKAAIIGLFALIFSWSRDYGKLFNPIS
jgi:hypothetical protein